MAITYDVGLDEDGDLQVHNYPVTGLALVLQRVRLRLLTFLGEWILDASKGLPFLRWIATKPPDAAVIGAVVRREIETTPGVLRVEEYTCTWIPAEQRIAIAGNVITAAGELTIAVSPLGTRTNRNPGLSILSRTIGRIGG